MRGVFVCEAKRFTTLLFIMSRRTAREMYTFLRKRQMLHVENTNFAGVTKSWCIRGKIQNDLFQQPTTPLFVFYVDDIQNFSMMPLSQDWALQPTIRSFSHCMKLKHTITIHSSWQFCVLYVVPNLKTNWSLSEAACSYRCLSFRKEETERGDKDWQVTVLSWDICISRHFLDKTRKKSKKPETVTNK